MIKLRFVAMSDVHVGVQYNKEKNTSECVDDGEGVQKSIRAERLGRAIEFSKKYALTQPYKKIDILHINGDFTHSGTFSQMKKVKSVLDEHLPSETRLSMTLASHEFKTPDALQQFREIFSLPTDEAFEINGYHFISLSCSHGVHFDEEKCNFASLELKKAHKDTHEKPIFFFQHPHISSTVYGSHVWGVNELYPILMNYPQIIDFSGHSHVSVNHPRSVHQKHFTSVNTGTLSHVGVFDYEMEMPIKPIDRWDNTSQFLIVEVDENDIVYIKPVDNIEGKFFDNIIKIENCFDENKFIYTDDNYYRQFNSCMPDNPKLSAELKNNTLYVKFKQCTDRKRRMSHFIVTVRDRDGYTVKRKIVPSGYYVYNMCEDVETVFDDVESAFSVDIVGEDFFGRRTKQIRTTIQ